MAELYKHDEDERESWLTWAIEFMRRGLWPDEEITVHGPHDSSHAMWGSAEAELDCNRNCRINCCFSGFATARFRYSKYRPQRIRIWNESDENEHFPILRTSELTPRARKWLSAAERTLKKLRKEGRDLARARRDWLENEATQRRSERDQ